MNLGTSKRTAHCGQCEHTFTTVSNFDRHLRGMDPVTCLHPTQVGLELKPNGRWGMPPRDMDTST